jgi:PhnB protein
MNNSVQLAPYLHFNGNCEEAMNFYQSVFGGKLDVRPFANYPAAPTPEDYKQKVMHSSLDGDLVSFMASDSAPGMTVDFGTNVTLSLAGTDEATLTKYFNGLAEGGNVTMALSKQMWGDTFGMITDKFGVHWMVNISSSETPAQA